MTEEIDPRFIRECPKCEDDTAIEVTEIEIEVGDGWTSYTDQYQCQKCGLKFHFEERMTEVTIVDSE